LSYRLCPSGLNLFILFFINEAMGAIPQKWIFACSACGCIFTTMAEKQTGLCPVCKSSDMNKIEGFD
jgi:rRNA maturation endonuclease Nob1